MKNLITFVLLIILTSCKDDKGLDKKLPLPITEKNIPALKKFMKHLKEINPDVLIFFQITHSGEISSNVYSKRIRVTKTPLPGYEDAVLVGEKEITM